jgi:hypothetical protein
MRAGHVTAKAAPIMRLHYGTVAKRVPIFKENVSQLRKTFNLQA